MEGSVTLMTMRLTSLTNALVESTVSMSTATGRPPIPPLPIASSPSVWGERSARRLGKAGVCRGPSPSFRDGMPLRRAGWGRREPRVYSAASRRPIRVASTHMARWDVRRLALYRLRRAGPVTIISLRPPLPSMGRERPRVTRLVESDNLAGPVLKISRQCLQMLDEFEGADQLRLCFYPLSF
jgi:hypothetical protein